ncbi:uncharacterized protein PV07_02546 [Cladophialophora immunda]|uniref:Uncharacterized protein n=1 Tax=Cladophialophora immunda TaxID=569365 RepID=A0A0D2CI80_9EURO|nr:uncharacterized protein PV07_02546 [Cladophialophora immunda]KIW30853.1 hypothetical protein PV07_02546 [Cladophialophora immunda]OQV02166.1 Ankyrin repeat-containing protein [Cladophialophora immunda]
MDPLSASASVIAVLQLSGEVVKYVNEAIGATTERKRLRDEVRACEDVLQQLKDEAAESREDEDWRKRIKALEGPDGPLTRLSATFKILKVELQPKQGLRRISTALKWPLTREKVDKLVQAIEREKSLLTFALTNDCRKLMQNIKKSAIENHDRLADLIATLEIHSTSRFEELKGDIEVAFGHLKGSQERKEAAGTREAILRWLTQIDYAPQQNDFVSLHQPGTCEWLLLSPQYTSWLQAHKQTLFCPGIPGSGKTIMTSVVVQDLLEKRRCQEIPCATAENESCQCARVGIAYLYCNFRRQHEQQSQDLLTNLLKQLAAQTSLPGAVKDLYDRHHSEKTQPTLLEISDTLRTVAAGYSRVFLIVDALDECHVSDGNRSRFLSELFELQDKTGANLFVTSRPLPAIEQSFEGCISREILATEEDIGMYIDGHMSQVKLPDFVLRRADLQDDIKAGIVKSVRGMFLLAKLHLDSLAGKKSPKAVRNALQNLAAGSDAYDQAYEDAMERIGSQLKDQKELAMQVLSWITCAKRPLTTLALQHALAVEPDEPDIDQDNLTEVHDMVSVCAGLIIVDKKSDIIRLVHYTTQEYFERTKTRWFMSADDTIAQTCLAYLSFQCFASGPCLTDEELEKRLLSYPLYGYAATNWGFHARTQSLKIRELVLSFLESDPIMSASNQAALASKGSPGYSQRVPRFRTGLHIAACFGLTDVVMSLLMKGCETSPKDSYLQTPLMLAAANGHDVVVSLLLNSEDVNSRDMHGRTALSLAAEMGRDKAVMKLLTKNGIDTTLKDRYDQTPLAWAAAGGHNGVVDLLSGKGPDDLKPEYVSFGAEHLVRAAEDGNEAACEIFLRQVHPNSVNKAGHTPLHAAAASGNEAIVNMMMAIDGVDVNIKSRSGMTPFACAVAKGHEGVCRILLGTARVNPDERYCNGEPPLSIAARNQRESIVELLLETGANPRLQDDYRRTPLWYAARNGSTSIIELLLKKGADVDSEDDGKRTPLSLAAENNYQSVAGLLLAHGANPNAEDGHSRTPASFAAENGHMAVIETLLEEEKLDLNVSDMFGRTALVWAAELGHPSIVKLILKRMCENDSQHTQKIQWLFTSEELRTIIDLLASERVGRLKKSGFNLVLYAAKNGHTLLVKFLLEIGCSPDHRDHDGRTPFYWAADGGHEDVLRLLLVTGRVEPDMKQGRLSQTPLSRAAGKGHKEVVQWLLTISEVDPDSADKYKRTPLSWAAEGGHQEVVRLLLATGRVNPDSVDEKERTPLSLAAEGGHQEVAQLLLATGRVNPNSRDWLGRTPLSRASGSRGEGVTRWLLQTEDIMPDSKDDDDRTPLSWAAESGQQETVRLLLATGRVELDSKDKCGQTPLSRAAARGHEGIVQWFLGTGQVNPETRDEHGQSPLSWAAEGGHEGVVRLLLAAEGVEPDSQDKCLRTPLWWAAEGGHAQVVKLLLETGKVNPGQKSIYNQTAMDRAVRESRRDVVQLLRSA